MHHFRIVPAETVPAASRAALINAAYVDYYTPLQVTAEQVRAMDTTYDVDLGRSVVAEAPDGLVGVAMLSHRGNRGWVSAVGTLPGYRRQGLATRMMQALLVNARSLGLHSVALEVIDRNAPARALYAALGFRETRELLSWRFSADSGPLPIPFELLEPVAPEQVFTYFDDWHERPPCWQREAPSLRRMAPRALGYLLRMDGFPAGYCLVSERGDQVSILDVGINPVIGYLRAGRVLLQALANRYRDWPMTLMNVPADDGMSRVLAALHFHVNIRQMEMLLELSG